MTTLVVVYPFLDYKKGDPITDAGTVASILAGPFAADVVRVGAPGSPPPPPPPPPPSTIGCPPGGTTGQALRKYSNLDYEYSWQNDPFASTIVTVTDNVTVNEDNTATGNIFVNDTTTGGALSLMQFTIAGVLGIFQPAQTATMAGIGSITISLNGDFTFTPVANYNGTVPVVTYQCTNGVDSKFGHVAIVVAPVADAPVAVDDSANGAVNQVVTVSPLSNDTSIDGGTLSITQVGGTNISLGGTVVVGHATVSLGAGNVLTITPEASYVGVVSFSYRCTDSNGLSSTATITVTYVNPEAGESGDYYISPNGSDSNTGTNPATPFKTFAYAFSVGGGSKKYVLMDGTYTTATTGILNWNTAVYGLGSAQAPSGNSTTSTIVIARNAGQVLIEGPLFVGRSSRKDSYIEFQGLRFKIVTQDPNGFGSSFYNTTRCKLKFCAMEDGFGIGTGDHTQGNSYNLVEDCWIWAAGQRIIGINYRANFNVWRRVVFRGDGCGTNVCAGSGAPNVGFTCYDSQDNSFQNLMVIDRILSPTDTAYGDFASAQHTAGTPSYQLGRNEWLGCISVKAPDSAYYFEADEVAPTGITYRMYGCAAFSVGTAGGMNMSASLASVDVDGVTLISMAQANDGLRIAPMGMTGTAKNVIVKGYARGFNCMIEPTYIDTFNSAQAFNQTTPTVGVHTTDPQADGTPPSIKYITRVEAGSALKGAGASGADIGANITKRWGVDGTHYGDTGYNTLQSTDLWPWPQEARIKSEMSATVTRGFCASGLQLDGITPITLTSYVWELLGNQMPSGIYPSTSVPTSTAAPVISGEAVHGGALTTSMGAWAGSPMGYLIAWLRYGTPIPGATSASYTVQSADIGTNAITSRITAQNSVGDSLPAISNPTTIIAATAPSVGTAPTLTGTHQIGGVSDASGGSFNGSPTPARSYQWKLDGVNVGGNTATYTNAATGSLTCAITATNVAGSVTYTTASVTVTAGTAPSFSAAPTISPTSGPVGTVFTVTHGTAAGVPTPTITGQWKLDGVNISGETGSTYTSTTAGALTITETATNGVGSPATSTSGAATVSAALTRVVETFGGAAGSITSRASDLGQTWSIVAGGGGSDINTTGAGVGGSSAAVSFTALISSQVPATASQVVGMDVNIIIAAKNHCGPAARVATDGSSGYFTFNTTGVTYLYERVSNTNTLIGSWTGSATRVVLDITDATKKVFIDGTERISVSTNNVPGVGRFGIALVYTDPIASGGGTIDNFEAYAR